MTKSSRPMHDYRWLPKHLCHIQAYVPGKPVEEVRRELGIDRVIKLASNESPYGPSSRVLAAIRQALDEIQWYPDGGGYYLRQALAAYHGVSMQEIALGAGSTEIVQLLVQAFLTHEDHAVVADITFLMYRLSLEVQQIPYTVVPLQDGHYDIDAYVRALRPNTKMVFLANPNNPTGTYITQEELQCLVDALPERTLLVYDEAYIHYVDRPDYPDAMTFYRQGYPIVILRTFSKVYGLAGLRIGYAIAHPEVVRGINIVRSPFNTSHIAQVAARTALEDTDHVRTVVRVTCEQRTWLASQLANLGMSPYPSVANFLCVRLPDRADTVYQRLLHAGVIVRPLGPFGMPDGLRITVGRPEENVYLVEQLQTIL